MEWPCFSVVAMGDGPSPGPVGVPAAQRGRTSFTPVRAVAVSFTEKQGWVSAPGSPSRILGAGQRDVCVPAPSLIWVLEPATGQVRRQDAGLGTGCARPRSLWRPPAAGPWRQARCGRRPQHICCAVGQGTHASSSSQAATGTGRSGTGASAASPSPIRVWRTRRASLRATVRAARLPSTRVLTWV